MLNAKFDDDYLVFKQCVSHICPSIVFPTRDNFEVVPSHCISSQCRHFYDKVMRDAFCYRTCGESCTEDCVSTDTLPTGEIHSVAPSPPSNILYVNNSPPPVPLNVSPPPYAAPGLERFPERNEHDSSSPSPPPPRQLLFLPPSPFELSSPQSSTVSSVVPPSPPLLFEASPDAFARPDRLQYRDTNDTFSTRNIVYYTRGDVFLLIGVISSLQVVYSVILCLGVLWVVRNIVGRRSQPKNNGVELSTTGVRVVSHQHFWLELRSEVAIPFHKRLGWSQMLVMIV